LSQIRDKEKTIISMNVTTGYTLNSSSSMSNPHSYSNVKRSHSAQSSASNSAIDIRELTLTLQELNNHFKKNLKILTDIKDQINKFSEKQTARPVDDNSGIHKLERVCIVFFSYRIWLNQWVFIDLQKRKSSNSLVWLLF